MAILISKATGNFTAAGTWGTTSTTAGCFLDSEAGTTTVTTGNLDSAAFTPGVETWEGVALKCSTLNVSPTGTLTVILRNSTLSSDVTSVTVNVSDLPYLAASNAVPTWMFFKFSSPVTTLTATNYVVRCTSSSSSQVTLYRDGTANNWSRFFRTSTTAAPGASDQLLVLGEYTGAGTSNSYTVTMDSTSSATSYGSTTPTDAIAIGGKGTMTFGASASTAYKLKYKGRMRVMAGGTLNIGTSGTPMPSTSSAELIMDVASNVDTGLYIENNATFNSYGNRKNNYYSLLTTNAAAAATSIVVSSTTDWVANDEVAFAPTSRTSTEFEKRTIQSITNGTTFVITSGLTNAHNGTSPTQGEVVNLTRNVKIYGASASLQGYVTGSNYSTIACDSVEFYFLGSATTLKRGIDLRNITTTALITYCSLHDFSVASSMGISTSGSTASNITISNNVFYNIAINAVNVLTTSGSISVTANVAIGGGSGALINSTDAGSVFTDNRASGGAAGGFSIVETSGAIGTFSGNVSHSNASVGFTLTGFKDSSIGSITAWRNGAAGAILSTLMNVIFDTASLFANTTSNLNISSTNGHLTFKSYTVSADSSFATTNGLLVSSGGTYSPIAFHNCDFGTANGIFVAHTNDFNFNVASSLLIRLVNCKLASSVELTGQSNLDRKSLVSSQNHDQTENSHKYWQQAGIGTSDATLVTDSYTLSERMTPSSATAKMFSSPRLAAIADTSTVTINVKVRKSTVASGDAANYNGNQPRLIVRANPALGSNFNSDTVLDTATAASDGAWETLTATTSATTSAGAMEFYVDCDGTTGFANISSWSVS